MVKPESSKESGRGPLLATCLCAGGVTMKTDSAVGIVGGNELVREGLSRILSDQGFRVLSTAPTVDAFSADMDHVDIVLVDSTIEDVLSKIEGLKSIRSDLKVVLLSDTFSAEEVRSAFQSDAVDGYVVKVIGCQALGATLLLAAAGEKVFPSQLAQALNQDTPDLAIRAGYESLVVSNLSTRESEILNCLVSGDANKMISRRLNISDATVKVHIKAILRKLKVTNRTQAAIWAVSHGISRTEEKPVPPNALNDALPSRTQPHRLVAALG